jgi:hypothetical protein
VGPSSVAPRRGARSGTDGRISVPTSRFREVAWFAWGLGRIRTVWKSVPRDTMSRSKGRAGSAGPGSFPGITAHFGPRMAVLSESSARPRRSLTASQSGRRGGCHPGAGRGGGDSEGSINLERSTYNIGYSGLVSTGSGALRADFSGIGPDLARFGRARNNTQRVSARTDRPYQNRRGGPPAGVTISWRRTRSIARST